MSSKRKGRCEDEDINMCETRRQKVCTDSMDGVDYVNRRRSERLAKAAVNTQSHKTLENIQDQDTKRKLQLRVERAELKHIESLHKEIISKVLLLPIKHSNLELLDKYFNDGQNPRGETFTKTGKNTLQMYINNNKQPSGNSIEVLEDFYLLHGINKVFAKPTLSNTDLISTLEDISTIVYEDMSDSKEDNNTDEDTNTDSEFIFFFNKTWEAERRVLNNYLNLEITSNNFSEREKTYNSLTEEFNTSDHDNLNKMSILQGIKVQYDTIYKQYKKGLVSPKSKFLNFGDNVKSYDDLKKNIKSELKDGTKFDLHVEKCAAYFEGVYQLEKRKDEAYDMLLNLSINDFPSGGQCGGNLAKSTFPRRKLKKAI